MITKRIIPCLDGKDGRVVKGVNFKGLLDVFVMKKLDVLHIGDIVLFKLIMPNSLLLMKHLIISLSI